MYVCTVGRHNYVAPKPTYNVLVRGGGQRLGVKM